MEDVSAKQRLGCAVQVKWLLTNNAGLTRGHTHSAGNNLNCFSLGRASLLQRLHPLHQLGKSLTRLIASVWISLWQTEKCISSSQTDFIILVVKGYNNQHLKERP